MTRVRLGARQALERDAGDRGQRVFVDAQLPVENALGDQEGELHDVPFGAAAQIGAHIHDFGDGSVEALHNGLQFGARLLLALLPSGFECLAAFRWPDAIQAGAVFAKSGDLARRPDRSAARSDAGEAPLRLGRRADCGKHHRLDARRAVARRTSSTLDNILFPDRALHGDDALGFELPDDRDDLLLRRLRLP